MTADATSTTPRPINPAARRQSWRELPVRIAALVALGMVIVVIVVAARAISQGLTDRRLIRTGTHVTATVIEMIGSRHPKSEATHAKISYRFPDDTPDMPDRVIEGDLTPVLDGGDWVSVATPTLPRSTLPIIVNPADPTDWTDRVDPPSWAHAMTVPLLLTPLVLLAVGLMIWQRARVLRVYRDGIETSANVVELKKSALLPSGRVMKVAPHTAGGRVLTLVRPNRLGEPLPASGENVAVILDDAERPSRALLADAYADLT